MTTDNNTQVANTATTGDGSTPGVAPVVITEAEITELRNQLASVTTVNQTLANQLKEISLANLPADQRAKAELLLKGLEETERQQDQSAQLEERARGIRSCELALEYSPYGVTPDMLKGAKTELEMESLALRAKADFLEGKSNGNSTGTSTGADPSKISSDKGGSGGGGGKAPSMEGVKGREAVAAHIGSLFAAKHGN